MLSRDLHPVSNASFLKVSCLLASKTTNAHFSFGFYRYIASCFPIAYNGGYLSHKSYFCPPTALLFLLVRALLILLLARKHFQLFFRATALAFPLTMGMIVINKLKLVRVGENSFHNSANFQAFLATAWSSLYCRHSWCRYTHPLHRWLCCYLIRRCCSWYLGSSSL